eukprot:CAMPEP_0175797098 /NCGR_PEP_ID=MMETSP0097-20121207/85301_1 /TAXON_ID=311494 /ORGANISM="Alexandrium monilatum, Strain CCMP3105" /LENGTH=51 /DNA_ID=CAMNT_0017108295 /DNA_START=23 /DNA_END=174 /DNA_ORIENTATION=-
MKEIKLMVTPSTAAKKNGQGCANGIRWSSVLYMVGISKAKAPIMRQKPPAG